MTWDFVLFETDRGEKPVEEFIKSLEKSFIAKVTHVIDLLEIYGAFLTIPHTKRSQKNSMN